MASPQSPGAALVRAARGEDQRIERALAVIEQRRSALLAQVSELDREAAEYRRRKQLLEQLVSENVADLASTAEVGPPDDALRAVKGRELRRVAGQILWASEHDGQIHYREWFERVLAAGYAVGGKDPVASFLTNVRDSPAVVRGTRQGYYRLESASLDRVAQGIREAEAELADAEQSLERARLAGDRARIDELRTHRDRLNQTLRRQADEVAELRHIFGLAATDADQVDESHPKSGLRAA
jgi:DNA repair exonuclease SbcCD ATPase subunit